MLIVTSLFGSRYAQPGMAGANQLKRLSTEALTGSWLAQRLALEPRLIEAMRRSGELIAVRPPGSWEHYYPVWQFDEEWRPLPAVQRVTRAARERGLSDDRLYEVLSTRLGLGGEKRLASALRAENGERVVAAVRAAGP
jgi:hypothetical protein